MIKNILLLTLTLILTLPQSIIGLILTLFVKKEKIEIYKIKNKFFPFILITTTNFNGVSLGIFIILNKDYIKEKNQTTIKHEYGHLLQGIILSWLNPILIHSYIFIIGIKSFINNRLSYFNYKDYHKNYYNKYPEKQADKLGGVKR